MATTIHHLFGTFPETTDFNNPVYFYIREINAATEILD